MSIPLTPLESWIAGRIAGASQPTHVGALSIEALRAWQLARLNETLHRVRARSRYYQRTLRSADPTLVRLEHIERLPFTTADDVRAAPLDFLCVPQHEVERIVTLPTSGTTGAPKRIFFTPGDQETTTDFFHRGMSTLVGPGDRVLILLPGGLPGSVGDLLKAGLARMDVEGIPHGPVIDPAHTLGVLDEAQVTALVGIPIQVLSLVKTGQALGLPAPASLRAVLLSTDRLPQAVRQAVEQVWGCEVYDHYGATEMGLGGGVDCRARTGYHLREADLLFEIIDPQTLQPVAEGASGEVVFTTLTREAMPLVRYRTGDVARFLPSPCACGTVLRRMAHIDERLLGGVVLSDGLTLRQGDLDEALLPLDGVADFRVLLRDRAAEKDLVLCIRPQPATAGPDLDAVMRALTTIPALAAAIPEGRVAVRLSDEPGEVWASTGTAKRKIERKEVLVA